MPTKRVLLADGAPTWDKVESESGTDHAHPIERIIPNCLGAQPFPSGSMGPKLGAARRIVEATGGRAVIGRQEGDAHRAEPTRRSNADRSHA